MAQFLQQSATDGSTLVRVVGEVDLSVVEDLKEAVRPSFAEGAVVEVDLSELEFIDSSGLGAFVQLLKEAGRRGSTLRLTRVSASTFRLFEVTGLAGVFDIRPDTQDLLDGPGS